MKLSYNWLKDYLESDLTPQQIADAMTAIGIEVDGVEEQEEIPGGLAGVVVAEVLEVRRILIPTTFTSRRSMTEPASL